MKYDYRLEVKAPVERVFALVDDEEKLKLWMDGLQETTYPHGRDTEHPVGTRFKQKMKEGGKTVEYEGEVTSYDKPRHLGVCIWNDKFSVQVDYKFQPSKDGGGTRLDYTCELTFHSLIAGIMGRLFKGMTRKILDKQMQSLKQLAERPA